MQLRQLEYLVALAREKHFARAATTCRVSQPALSEAIRRLEREFGLPLIERDQSFHRMTAAGERVVDWAHRILADVQSLQDDVASMRSGLTGTLRLAAIPTAVGAMRGIIRAFTTAHPGASVAALADQSTDAVAAALASFEIDAGISYLDALPAGLTGVPLYREHLAVALDRESVDPVWFDTGFPPDRLGELPLVSLSRRNQWRRRVDQALTRRGIDFTPRVETDSVAVIHAQLRHGGFAALVSREWAEVLGLPSQVTTVPIDLGIEPVIGLVVRDDEPAPPMVAAAVAAAQQQGRL